MTTREAHVLCFVSAKNGKKSPTRLAEGEQKAEGFKVIRANSSVPQHALTTHHSSVYLYY